MNHGSLIYVLQGVPKKSDSRTLAKQLLPTKSTIPRERIFHFKDPCLYLKCDTNPLGNNKIRVSRIWYV